MAILKIARLGHPILRKVAQPVKEKEIKKPEFQAFLEDMSETMHEYDGIGLAAPQVHRSSRISVVEIREENRRYPNKKLSGLHVFINPKVTVLSKEMGTYWEGCLSVPGMRGLVARPSKIRVEYLDRDARKHEVVAENFLATVLQHEFDHLDGKLYVDKLADPAKFAFDKEFEKYWLPNAEDADEVG